MLKELKFNNLYKVISFIFVLIILGLPIIELWKAALLLVIGIYLWHSNFKLNKYSYIALLLIFLLTITKFSIPELSFEEGDNIFLPKPYGTVTYSDLPPTLRNKMSNEFMKYHPKHKWCDEKNPSCWRHTKTNTPQTRPDIIKDTYSTSAETIWHHPKYTRILHSLDIKHLSTLRGGFVNRDIYNWYDWQTNLYRFEMPFFVMIEINKDLVGSKLCWTGKTYWTKGNKAPASIETTQFSCAKISPNEIGFHVYAVSANPKNPLEIKLIPSTKWQIYEYIQTFISICLIISLLSFFKLKASAFAENIFIFGICLIALYATSQNINLYTYEFALSGGYDGLTYKSIGLHMIDAFRLGNFIEVLRGGSDVYYNMPGMFYFRFIEGLIFGQTNLGVFCIAILLLTSCYYLTKKVLPTIPAIVAFLMFFATFTDIYNLGLDGYAEPIAIFFLVSGILLTFEENHKQLWFGTLFLAISVFFRPNYLFGVLFITGASIFYKRKSTPISKLIYYHSGILFCGVSLLHNLVFGHQFIIFTSASSIPDNLRTTPIDYFKSLGVLIGYNEQAEIHTIYKQISLWLDYPFKSLKITSLLITVLAAITPLKKLKQFIEDKYCFNIKMLSIAALGLQLPLLFWVPFGRYAAAAWGLSYLVAVSFVFYTSKVSLLKINKYKPRLALK